MKSAIFISGLTGVDSQAFFFFAAAFVIDYCILDFCREELFCEPECDARISCTKNDFYFGYYFLSAHIQLMYFVNQKEILIKVV